MHGGGHGPPALVGSGMGGLIEPGVRRQIGVPMVHLLLVGRRVKAGSSSQNHFTCRQHEIPATFVLAVVSGRVVGVHQTVQEHDFDVQCKGLDEIV
jgi:hypothetical protein